MTNYLKLLLVIACVISLPINANDSDEFKPVLKVFTGISLADHDLIKSAVTDDFLLLEVGEVWDTDILLSFIEPSASTRKNHFSIISTHDLGEAVLINYWNKAHITTDGKETIRAWLESVVSVKTKDGWKLLQMHSTRLKPEAIPKDVVFELLEYTEKN